MTTYLRILALILCILTVLPTKATGDKADGTYSSLHVTPLQQLNINGGQGVSAPYAGMSSGYMLVAGGCNFPGTPAADGGTKQYYDNIYICKPGDNSPWQEVGKLNTASAYGVGVTVADGVVTIGGTDGQKSLCEVSLLTCAPSGKVTKKLLPPLPAGIDNMAGAYGGGYIYVAGGRTDGKPANKAYRMQYPGGKNWERLPDFPGPPRLQPVASVQQGANGPAFYLMGGYCADSTLSDGLCYDPLNNTWRHTAPIIVNGKISALVGAGCVNSGASSIVCIGGVDMDISNTTLLVYNTITDTWNEQAVDSLTAKAGATVIDCTTNGKRQWIVVNGETKPGMQGNGVTSIEVSYNASFGWSNWAVLVAYLLAMLLLGYYFMHKEKNPAHFFTGGGRIPWWAAGMSIFATVLSAITYMSIPAKAYATDWKYYPMQIMILVVAFPVIRYYLPFFRRLNVSTAYAYLEQRFNYGVRAMASILFIIFMTARMALVLFLPSLAMTAVTGIDIYLCILLMAVTTTAYCTMGGMEAVVWGDVVQGFILIGGALLAAIYLVTQTEGGAPAFFDIAMANDKFVLFNWSLDYRSATFWVIILGGLANNLISYTSDQTIIQRYMTTSSERSASRGIITNALLNIFVSIVFYTIGTGLYTFFKTHPQAQDFTMDKTDTIFPFFMMSQLPAGVAGLLTAALFAASMSTISSNINSISTAFTMDIYKKWRPQTNGSKTLIVARRSSIIAGLAGSAIAILMATADIHSLLDYFNTILGLLTGATGGLFMMGIFFKRINAACSLAGFICGTLTVFYMNYFTQASFFLFGFTSLVVSVAVALLLSLIWPNKKNINGLTWKTIEKCGTSTHKK